MILFWTLKSDEISSLIAWMCECVSPLWTNLLDDHNMEHMFRGSLVYSTSLSIRFVCLISHSLSLVSFVYFLTKRGRKCIPHHVWYGGIHVWYRGENCIPHTMCGKMFQMCEFCTSLCFYGDLVLRRKILVFKGRQEFLAQQGWET